MHTDAEESGMLNVIPRVRHSPNDTPHRTTHSPYDTSVFSNRTTERDTAVEANVSPQVRGIMRPPQRNGAQDVTVGSSDSAGAASVMERRQQQQQPLLRVGGARSGTGNEGVSSMIAGDDPDVHYEQVRSSIFNSAPPEALHGGSATGTKTRTNKPYVMPPLGAAPSGRSGGQERKQDSHDAPPDYGQSRGNDAKQSADASSASQMGVSAPMPLHQQHPKVENDAMDYQRHPRVMNLLPHHHHYQHQHHYQQHSYGPSFQGQMYDADYGERDGYDSSSQKRRFYSSAPPQVYQQYPGKFQQPPPLPQQQQQQHHQQHQQYSQMPHSFYSPPHADIQGCYPGGCPGHNVYSDPNNNHSSPTRGGDLRYSQDNTTSMHQRYNSNNNNNKNRNSPLPPPQQQQQQPQQQWSRTQMPYSVPSTSPNMTIGMTSQRVSSPYPSSGDGSYTRYSPTAAATCPGVAPPPGPPYSGMGQNWQSQSQSQPYPDDMQQPPNVPPAYHGNPALAGSYNTGMHRQDYMDSPNCGQQSNPGAPPPPPPPPPPSHHHHHLHHLHHHHHLHHLHPHQQQQWGYGSAHQQPPHPHQQQQPMQHPYPPEPGYNMPHTQHGFNRPSFGPPGAPGGNAAMAQHYNQQAGTAYHPESEPYAPHGQGNPQQSFQKQPHQSYQQHYQQAPSNGRFSGAPTVGLPPHRQSQQRHGQPSHARRGDSNGWGRGRGSGYGRGEQQQQGRKSNAKVSVVVVRGIPQAQVSADAVAGNEQNCNDANVTTGHASSLGGGPEPNQVEKSKK